MCNDAGDLWFCVVKYVNVNLRWCIHIGHEEVAYRAWALTNRPILRYTVVYNNDIGLYWLGLDIKVVSDCTNKKVPIKKKNETANNVFSGREAQCFQILSILSQIISKRHEGELLMQSWA